MTKLELTLANYLKSLYDYSGHVEQNRQLLKLIYELLVGEDEETN